MEYWQVISWCETDHIVEVAQHAEKLGFTGLILAEHIYYPQETTSRYYYSEDGESVQNPEMEFPDPLISFAAAAAVTETLQFMTGIYVVPLRHPIELAKNLATLARLSDNRVHLGLGAGWLKEEFDQFGVDFSTRGARTDVQKARQIYDWVVTNTYREPKVRGCGEGDIKTMLETGNLGGKCADLNAVFVGLCRAAGVPARDVYGLRLAPSAFGYKELGGNPASLKGAQHCRAEVHLAGHGWVAMDPADVAKVMRQETPEWIKTTQHPLVAPVNRGLFGGWEGNWVAWNMAHDVQLPQARGPELGFFMYPTAEVGGQRLDSYAPDDFKYQISAREIKA